MEQREYPWRGPIEKIISVRKQDDSGNPLPDEHLGMTIYRANGKSSPAVSKTATGGYYLRRGQRVLPYSDPRHPPKLSKILTTLKSDGRKLTPANAASILHSLDGFHVARGKTNGKH